MKKKKYIKPAITGYHYAEVLMTEPSGWVDEDDPTQGGGIHFDDSEDDDDDWGGK